MPKNVVCKKCNNLVNDWCEKVIDSPDTDMQRDCQYFCEKTNADRIRAMSDEELAKFLQEPFCYKRTYEECTISYCGVCDQCVLDWLKQFAEEGER